MGSPKISILMGIYNCSATLEEAVDSINNQTYTNWELIMCDDGSKDNTYQLALEISSKNEKCIVIKNGKNIRLPGNGMSITRCKHKKMYRRNEDRRHFTCRR